MSEDASTPQRPPSKKAAVILGVVLLVIGLPMFLWGAWYLVQAVASSSWPTVEGRVKQVRVHRDSSGSGMSRKVHYRYSVEYAYDVEGTAYTSDKHAMGSGSTAGRAPTHSEASTEGRKRFPAGAEVTVYYDPDDPAMAVLQPGAGSDNWGTYVPTILGFLFAGLGAWIVLTMRKASRNERASGAATT